MTQTPMSAEEVHAFIHDRWIAASDPASGEHAAIIHYDAHGQCRADMAEIGEEIGEYGFEEAYYWTRYPRFRSGEINWFALLRVNETTAQAMHHDGRRAFLLTHIKAPN